jgi:hypothetical protein
MKRLLSALPDLTLEAFESRIRVAFSDPFWRNKLTLAALCSRWSSFCSPVTHATPKPTLRLAE